MIAIRKLNDPIRTLEQAVIECYRNALRRRDYERASWIARNFPIQYHVAA